MVVLGSQGNDNVCHSLGKGWSQAAHHAEVQVDQAVGRQLFFLLELGLDGTDFLAFLADGLALAISRVARVQPIEEDISRMRVRMEVVIFEDLLDEVFHQGPGNILVFFYLIGTGVDIIPDALARHGLVDQDFRSAVFRIDFRHLDDAVAVVQFIETDSVFGFAFSVDLVGQRSLQLVEDLVEVDHLALRGEAQQLDGLLQEVQVDGDQLGYSGVLDLDDYFGAVLQPCPVRLTDGGGSKGLAVEFGEVFLNSMAGFFLIYRRNGLETIDGDVILEFAQLFDVGGTDQVGPGGQHLADFDKGRAEFFQGFPHLDWIFLPDEVGQGAMLADDGYYFFDSATRFFFSIFSP